MLLYTHYKCKTKSSSLLPTQLRFERGRVGLDYIHHNPVSGKWSLVNDFAEYEHSSASFYELGTVKHFKPRDYKEIWYADEYKQDKKRRVPLLRYGYAEGDPSWTEILLKAMAIIILTILAAQIEHIVLQLRVPPTILPIQLLLII